MSPNELLQSRTISDVDARDSELMQTTLSQYQTPTLKYEVLFFTSIRNRSFVHSRPENDQPNDELHQARSTRNTVSSVVR